ncbi:hypothetical protein ACQP2X_04425 [Actinoplanes sp. CA-131856]
MAPRPIRLGLCLLALAGCSSSPEPAPSPSPSERRAIELVPDQINPDQRTVEVLTGEGVTADLVSHAFNDGVVQVSVRSSVDERLRLCDRLVDEFRDNQSVRQILVTAVPAAPLVHWNSSDPGCVADPATQ